MSYYDDMSQYYGPPGPPGPYGPPPGRTMRVMMHLYANQSVEVRLNADSPWMVGIVLAVLNVAEQNFGIRYDIQYRSGPGHRYHRKVFPADSPNIRMAQSDP
ncbi:hypothetical protein FB45DRAFT_1019031 [Roridomyces roridus]|uniref:Uncharacterized protein n=1 Tax=Roridomyces roridus TaxID=1738132 RepID=A0AAD7FZK6_9AGAR|nr:hypothetical protein FB45DRAFT_1019031 [Roridomyces roridus]